MSTALISVTEIENRVIEVIEDTLGVERCEVVPTAMLQSDLGAESIDMLDLIFRLETEFDIRIERGELFPDQVFSGDPQYVVNGVITPEGMAKLKTAMPHSDFTRLDADPKTTNLGTLFTVSTVVKFVTNRLNK